MFRSCFWPAALCLAALGLTPFVATAADADATPATPAGDVPALGIDLAGYDYPYPVSRFALDTPHGRVSMAYMDVAPADGDPNAPTVVLLHGKNFSGAYWGDTAAWLTRRGYRVVMPDQIGFGKSDKPEAYSYTFAHLAANTQALLAHLGIEQATILGHSMGGMLATRYALMYPQAVTRLILVDPIGLEDWKAKGVPYRGMNAWVAQEMHKDYAGIKAYEKASYYHGTWRPAYDGPARMLAGMYASPNKSRLAYVAAATHDMIYNEPVVYEFGDLVPDTTLMVGSKDRTALGKDLVSKEKAATLGDYPALSRAAVAAMPHGHRVLFDGLGHLPFIEAPAVFRHALGQVLPDRSQHATDQP